MIQLFLNIFKPRVSPPATGDEEKWRCDPLAHPALATMNQRELADLPFEPFRIRSSCGCEAAGR